MGEAECTASVRQPAKEEGADYLLFGAKSLYALSIMIAYEELVNKPSQIVTEGLSGKVLFDLGALSFKTCIEIGMRAVWNAFLQADSIYKTIKDNEKMMHPWVSDLLFSSAPHFKQR